MWLRIVFFSLLLVILAVLAAFYLAPGLVSAVATVAPIPGLEQRRLSFVQSVNDLGDRIYLTTPAGITVTPQTNAPDRVTITSNAFGGGRAGTFRFTVVPHQGSRGVRRAAGEFDTNGQVFRLCEVVDDPAGGLPPRAQRFNPINTANRQDSPVTINAGPFVQFIDAMIAGTPPGSNNRSFSAGGETLRLAETLVGLCSG